MYDAKFSGDLVEVLWNNPFIYATVSLDLNFVFVFQVVYHVLCPSYIDSYRFQKGWLKFIFTVTFGEYSVQKTPQGYAVNIGSKISLLKYQWPIIKWKNKLAYEWFDFFTNSVKIGSSLRKTR